LRPGWRFGKPQAMMAAHRNGGPLMPQAQRPAPEDPIAERVIDATLDLAEEIGWHDVRLFQVADRLDLPLAEIARRFRDQDAIANAWFARARTALLVPPEELQGLPPPERLHVVMSRWLDALAPRREVSADMLKEKLWPAHPHHWVPMAFDLSRLMHWFLDAARIASTGPRRAAAEVGLTLIFLATLRRWVADTSPGQMHSKGFLRRQLELADRALGLVAIRNRR
jgi:AcrR family transcriptional regulator